MNKEEVHCIELKDGRKVIVESLVEEIDLSRLDRKRLEKEAQDKQSLERENKVLILQQKIFTISTRHSK